MKGKKSDTWKEGSASGFLWAILLNLHDDKKKKKKHSAVHSGSLLSFPKHSAH